MLLSPAPSTKTKGKNLISLYQRSSSTNFKKRGDFPGSTVVKTLSSNAGGVGSVSGWGAKIPHTARSKNENIKKK